MKKYILSSFVLLFFVFTFSSCEEDRHLDWRYINQQWLEQQKLRINEETGEKYWKETESGLLYRIINEGIGDPNSQGRPSNRSSVTIAYTGTLFNDARFDNRPSDNPLVMPLRDFVRGFQEALRMMKLNGMIEVIIPYKLAYGDVGGSGIPPYSVLQFEIELMNFWTE
jgi:FKBP-type peptidyl-prolyl cis-trans isomerase